MSRSAYCRVECLVCGRRISTAGFARFNHRQKHLRENGLQAPLCTCTEQEQKRPVASLTGHGGESCAYGLWLRRRHLISRA